MPELRLQQSRLDGRYDVLECLGRGSYAEIYVAHDNAAVAGAPETVVIKALNTLLQDTPDADLERTLVANFQNEAVALDRVRHPNIISRLGHGTALDLAGTTFHYLVLEYLPGGDMAALARKSPLSIEKALFYLEQVCSGLAHAHKCRVIHRDIKPQNLLLTTDRQLVKIADFGVARLEANEGAITRVGTNIYSAPEHNPLMQTGQLSLAGAVSSRDLLMPAADIYSLAKTTYALLAGEPPRRFSQHTITELPALISDYWWSLPVLRVLEKATQDHPRDRYQTVEAFWDDLSEAALPPTKPLQAVQMEQAQRRKPSEDLNLAPDEFTQAAPPQARFEIRRSEDGVRAPPGLARRPRIVVPFNRVHGEVESGTRRQRKAATKKGAATFVNLPNGADQSEQPRPAGRARQVLVALVLILGFSGMLLATHKYVTSHWNSSSWIPQLGDTSLVGHEGVTTTDVNLRPDASSTNSPVGLAEFGSRVKILNIDNNWFEVQVVAHGRSKSDPYSSDRGWINKRFVKFD